jgi:hypothetical protein
MQAPRFVRASSIRNRLEHIIAHNAAVSSALTATQRHAMVSAAQRALVVILRAAFGFAERDVTIGGRAVLPPLSDAQQAALQVRTKLVPRPEFEERSIRTELHAHRKRCSRAQSCVGAVW